MSLRAPLAVLLVALVAASPWLAYGAGLANVAGTPDAPQARYLTPAELEPLHLRLRKAGALTVPRLSPLDYAMALVDPERLSSGGVAVARFVAADYVRAHARWRAPAALRLSNGALTVWLTRNWTSDQIVLRATEIEAMRGGT